MDTGEIRVKRDTTLFTNNFVATCAHGGAWRVRPSEEIWATYVPSPEAWFAEHAQDNCRHLFYDEFFRELHCADEMEATALLKQLEWEYIRA